MNASWEVQRWRRALVYGLGLSGMAALRLLRSRGIEVVGVDRRQAAELELGEVATDAGVRLELGRELESPGRVDGVVVSPGVPLDRPLLATARSDGLPVLAEVELASQWLTDPLLAITGSNGKSTTAALTAELLVAGGHRVELCGNIGRPLSACVEGPRGRLFVVELSSFQLEAVVTLKPRAAAFLNLAADHLDRHGDELAYLRAKRALFERQGPEDLAILNADDPRVAASPTRARRRFFSRRGAVADGCYLSGDAVLETLPGRPPKVLFRRRDLGLVGDHNLENAMAAALLAREFQVGAPAIRRGLRAFPGLPHRMQRVATVDGVLWIDDSKATNVAATAASLQGFPPASVHLILGGRTKGDDPRNLLPVATGVVRRLYFIGEAGPDWARALDPVLPGEVAGDMEHAVDAARRQARPGEVVLLAPACASFDQYRDFGDRGDHFQRLVMALDGEVDGEEAGV